MYEGAPRLTFFDVRGLGERSPAGWREEFARENSFGAMYSGVSAIAAVLD